MDEQIKSFLNYPGNKYNLIPQINKLFENYDEKKHIFYDVFCGSGTVGYNSKFENVVFIDSNRHIIELHKYIHENSFAEIINNIERIIKKYQLSNSNNYTYKFYKQQIKGNPNNGLKEFNTEGYYKLREDYNKLSNKYSKKAIQILHVLTIYSFNNDIRHNSKEEFNLPCGKTDFNMATYNKILKFKEKTKLKKYQFMCLDILNSKNKIPKNAIIYFDPPYLITNAVYNTTSNWTFEKEVKLYKFIKQLQNDFVLSNLLSNVIINEELNKFISNYNFTEVSKNYSSSSYNKKNRYIKTKEILVWKN